LPGLSRRSRFGKQSVRGFLIEITGARRATRAAAR